MSPPASCKMAQEESLILQEGRHVLFTESKALETLARSLNNSFEQAVHYLENTKGRVVLCGLGKSGHIARKISATFASTGCPSFFVHAAEASHGDLGMVTPLDVLFLISYSGETAELQSIIDYARRFSIPIVSITGRPTSTLARFSTVSLVLPDVPEACPMGLAPTTSTTLTLALGDSLAVALLSKKGFTAEKFQVFHPKGSLGHQLRRVQEIMHTGNRLPLVKMGTLMKEAILGMASKGFGCVGILDDANLLQGIITDGDLRRHMDNRLLERNVEDVMTRSPVTMGPDDLVADALSLMEQKKITNVFVTHQGTVKGILHIHDCLKF